MQFLEKLKPLGLFILRAALGATFIFHGYPKLSDPARALKAFPALGFPSYFAYISGVIEVFGGGLLIAGLFTRGAALLLAIEMGLVLGAQSCRRSESTLSVDTKPNCFSVQWLLRSLPLARA